MNDYGSEMDSSELIKLCHDHVFFSWSIQKDVSPIVVEGGEGVFYWDKDGKRYMDFSSQLMSLNLGYQHPKIIQAIQEQAKKLTVTHPGAVNAPKAILGKMITEVTPGDLNKVFYTLGGAEANENAIKFARLYTKRQKNPVTVHFLSWCLLWCHISFRRLSATTGRTRYSQYRTYAGSILLSMSIWPGKRTLPQRMHQSYRTDH